MQMNAAIFRGILYSLGTSSARFGGKIQGPVAGFPIVDASAVKLGQRVQHGLSGGSNQEGPMREFGGSKFASLPDFARRIDQQIAAIFAAQQSCAFLRQDQVSATTAK